MNLKIKKSYLTVALCSSLVLLTACHGEKHQEEKKHETIFVTKLETPIRTSYYVGLLQPVASAPVVSPVDGRIEEMHFDYGKNVTKDQLMVVINSSQLADQYQSAIKDYLTSKQTYSNAIESFAGSEALFKAGVTSKESFNLDKSSYDNAVLGYFQAKYKLEDVVKKLNVDPGTIEKLTLDNKEALNKVLYRRFNHIEVRSPGAGIALFPIQDRSGGGDEKSSGRLKVGSEVKSGQLLLSIGNLEGLSVQVQVSEVNIVNLKPGMPVTITGDAFQGVVMHGKVSSVAAQANPDSSGGGGGLASMYNVDISVPNLTPEQRKAIRIGMTSKVEVNVALPSKIVVPIKAVFRKNDQSMVTIVDAEGNRKDVPVETGATTTTDVVITKGLKTGERVVVHD